MCVCVCVCVVVVCDACVAGGCVVVYICICVIIGVSALRMLDKSVRTCISDHTSTIRHYHTVLAIAQYCSLYMFTTDTNVILLVCTYNVFFT